MTEPLGVEPEMRSGSATSNFLLGYGLFNMMTTVLSFLAVAFYLGPEREPTTLFAQEKECEY